MDKGDPVRKTKTHKPDIKLQIKLPPNRKARRRDMKRNKRIDYQGYGYHSHGAKGAHGKSKHLKTKEPYIKRMAEERKRVQNKIKRLGRETLVPERKKKCKDSLKLSQQSKSVRLASFTEGYGGQKMVKRSVDSAPENSKSS